MAFFSLSFFLSSQFVTFLPEGVIVGFPNFVFGFKSLPPGGRFLGFFRKNENYLESPDMA
jgi:hypothetical protein